MRILALTDPPRALNPKSDTTVAILDEALRRGHEIFVSEPHQLFLFDGGGETGAYLAGTDAYAVSGVQRERPNDPALDVAAQAQKLPLDYFSAVLMRKDPPYDTTYHLSTLILEQARDRCLLVNDPRGLREANEKLYIFNFPDLIAPTLVTNRTDELRAFMRTQGGEMVVKPLDGHGGLSVFHVRASDSNASTILEVMTHGPAGGRRWVMAQRYLDVGKSGDKRILLLDGEPIGAVLRMPQESELRSNLHVGGQAMRTELTDRDRHICARLKDRLKKDGLYFVGIDIIDGYLTEVNVTSPTTVQEIDRLNNVRLEAQIVDFLEQRAPKQRGAA
jgi:glutathione synthase